MLQPRSVISSKPCLVHKKASPGCSGAGFVVSVGKHFMRAARQLGIAADGVGCRCLGDRLFLAVLSRYGWAIARAGNRRTWDVGRTVLSVAVTDTWWTDHRVYWPSDDRGIRRFDCGFIGNWCPHLVAQVTGSTYQQGSQSSLMV